jgi:class 3 adenylate cyclase/tetratricopeptide (TPR) repeat protein
VTEGSALGETRRLHSLAQPLGARGPTQETHRSGIERKLATVLFVDLVGSTELVAESDPEVARRRVTQFFELVSGSIAAHGGIVEKFAGDAVMAAFGVPRAHEDDAERALRAALEIQGAVGELGVECRIGIEAGEVVIADADSTFATGQAVNAAARLQQVAAPNEILVGSTAHRLAGHTVDFESAGKHDLDGFAEPVEVWRALIAYGRNGRPVGALSVPIVGREAELELLQNTFERTVRDRRAHLVTIYGEPGVGKSRLAREFVAGLDGAMALKGRSLPYGQGITYWPLAEMVKAWAGIADDDHADVAREKLVESCEDEAVADLLALALGLLEAPETDRSQQEIAWAAREWAEQLAANQPLVLNFEDVHWAEEPLLRLIEHLAASVRDAPLLILCLARPELIETFPTWGGGRVRGVTIELGALNRHDAEELVDALLAGLTLPPEQRREVLDKTEGNPLFVEEMVRLLAEGTDGELPIPDTVQTLIAARIDGLPHAAKLVLQHAAVIGRVFWRSALAPVSEKVEDVDLVLEELVRRDFLVPEPRSSITGEEAFRFKHILIREIAYAGVGKADRAELHAAFAAWLHGRGVEELVEIRAYHLDRAVTLLGELDGKAPDALVHETASALEVAGVRAVAREANRAGRKLLLRAVELEPTLERRFQAARAAWRLDDIPAVAVEMERVRAEARGAGDRRIEGRAIIALGEVTAFRDSDLLVARKLIEEGLSLLEPDDLIGRFDALKQLSAFGLWVGNQEKSLWYAQEAFAVARRAGRKDLMGWAAKSLASAYLWASNLDRAEEAAAEALRLAEETGGIVPRGHALSMLGQVEEFRGNADAAAGMYQTSIALFAEAGAVLDQGAKLNHLAELVMHGGDDERAEELVREAIRLLKPLGDRGYLCESQRLLAEILVKRGNVEEAERYAREALDTVGPQDVTSLATTKMALGLVRAAQGRDGEAELLLREAVDAAAVAPGWIRGLVARRLAEFLDAQGRRDDAALLTGVDCAAALRDRLPGGVSVRVVEDV